MENKYEYDEDHAVEAMIAALGVPATDELRDCALETIDLIFDFYDNNDGLAIDNYNDDDADLIAAYVAERFKRQPATAELSAGQIKAMVVAELEYEDSLI
mgnify:FL=1